jgi:hypothetical protein
MRLAGRAMLIALAIVTLGLSWALMVLFRELRRRERPVALEIAPPPPPSSSENPKPDEPA